MPDTAIHGQTIAYQLSPPEGAHRPTIVFLHEGLGSLNSWRDYPARLRAATGCGTLVYSRWGYGTSSPRPIPWPASYLEDEGRDWLPALLGHLGLDDVVLYGHSDGGSIALVAAGLLPALVRAVVTEAAHVMVEDVTVQGVRALTERGRHDALHDGLARHHGDRADDVFAGWSGVWLDPGMRHWDIRPVLARIAAPVLAIQGLDDEYGTRAQVDAIVTGITSTVRPLLIPGCGHIPHRQAAHRVFHSVMGFLAHVGIAPLVGQSPA